MQTVLKEKDIKTSQISPVALAFIGDSVHTMFVRTSIVEKQELKINHYNSYASKLCSAVFQAKVFDKIKETLTEEEKEVARWARNTKTKSQAKGASVEEYKKATAFEAVIGFLHLENKQERLNHLLAQSLYVEEQAEK